MKNFILASLVLALVFAQGAFGGTMSKDNQAIVNFYTSENLHEVLVQIAYPGGESFVKNGRMVGTSEAPDCLVLTNDGLEIDKTTEAKMTNQIEVKDGFNPDTAVELKAELKNNTFVYFLKSLGGFLTKISVKTRDPSMTFTDLRNSVLGANGADNLRLLYSGGCQIVR
jgi:hypothetical protein